MHAYDSMGGIVGVSVGAQHDCVIVCVSLHFSRVRLIDTVAMVVAVSLFAKFLSAHLLGCPRLKMTTCRSSS